MRAGDLRRQIVIQQRNASQDTFAQESITWSDYINGVPAQIEVLGGTELITARAVNTEVSHRITVRYHPQFADPVTMAEMRVVYTNNNVTRYFNILACLNVDERNRTIEFMAQVGLNQGG